MSCFDPFWCGLQTKRVEQALLSSAFLGAFAGYIVSQFIILPTFLLALGGGGFLAYLATTKK